MSIQSTLVDLTARFTRMDQFEKVARFLLDAPLTIDEVRAISRALLDNRQNLEWDSTRLPEITRHITRVREDQARPPPAKGDDDDDGDGLAWWAWLLIVIGIIAGVGLIGGGGWYAYKTFM